MEERIILYIGGFELPDKNAAAQRVLANAEILNKVGYQVVFFGITKATKSVSDPLIRDESYENYPSQYPNGIIARLLSLGDISEIKSYLKKNAGKNIVAIIAYNIPSFALIRLINLGQKKRIKIIGDITEWYSGFGNILNKHIKNIDTYMRMEVLNKRCDGLITISSYLSNYYSGLNILEVPPLINKEAPKWHRNGTFIRNDDISRTFVYVGSPGHPGQKDRIDIVIDVFRKLKSLSCNFVLRIIGLTAEDFQMKYGNLVDIEVGVDLIFMGRLSHESALDFIKTSDFSIIIRSNNRVNNAGFPTKLVESIGCGTPVICSEISNVSDYFNQEMGFMVKSEDDSSLLDGFMKCFKLTNEELRKMKDYCYAYRGFDIRSYETKFRTFLTNVIS